jgi:formylmethanofuran:tetrahydromethanopterin formyltransferase
MKKIFLVFSIALLLSQIWAINKRKIALAGWRNTDYSVECIGTGNEGTQHLKVYFYFKKEKDAGLYAKKSAVDAILFRGISAGVAACFNQALVNADQMEQHNAYFQNFFIPGGEYLSYISASTDQLTNRIKVGDRYKAAMEVSVNLSQLRKKMENDQIIQGLSSGF